MLLNVDYTETEMWSLMEFLEILNKIIIVLNIALIT